jgi:hypothetical protein
MSSSHPPSPDKKQVKISFSILGIGVIVLTIIICILRIADYNSKWSLELRDYISLCSFGFVTIGLIYNAASLQYNYTLNKMKIEREEEDNKGKKVKITYEAMSDYHRSDMANNREITRRFIKPFKGKLSKGEALKEFKKSLSQEENMHIRRSLISILNYFEHLSLLSTDNVIDEEILKKGFRTAFISLYSNLKEYIEEEQRGNNGANAKIYISFVSICQKWL